MILNSLRLTDFGNFKGVQELSLRPKPGKPIVLVGGKNGAGKSTLLEAIRLCFYGPQAIAPRISREQYLAYLKSKIHRNPNFIIQPNYASVSIELEFADVDGPHTYKVVRGWEDHGSKVMEDFQIERDGQLLNEISSEHWQDFIRDLIPIGVSQLFFFDGEKIQQLAEDSTDQGALMNAVKLLLGVDVVERLDTDLGAYLSRSIVQPRTKEGNQLGLLESELEDAQSRLSTKRQDREGIDKELLEIKKLVDGLEQRLASSGGNFAKNRENYVRERQRVKSDIGRVRDELRELCAGLLPFAICRNLCLKLRSSLESEEKNEEQRVAAAFATRAASEIRSQLARKRAMWPSSIDPRSRRKIADEISSILLSLVSSAESKRIHGCSPDERRKLFRWIDVATVEMPRQVVMGSAELEKLARTEHRVEAELKKMPSEEALKPLLEELQHKYKKLAQCDVTLRSIIGEIEGLERLVADLTRRCREEANRLAANAAQESRLARVPGIRKALDDFKTAIIAKKVQSLEDAVTQCFNVLCRKKDSMRRVSIDAATFAVTIKDKDGQPIAKDQLSAGEKQVYAISMLWALSKTSGRPLPVIVDTPLARLDRDHRSLLAQHYFPAASHQVVILSTDTEVDEDYFEQLAPAISKAYLLEFDQVDRFTSICPEYFWRRDREAIKA